MKPETLAALERKHVRILIPDDNEEPHATCDSLECLVPWPCETAELLAYIRNLEGVVEEAKKVKFWGGAYGLRGFNEAVAALEKEPSS